MKQWLIAMFAVVALTACGGGSSGDGGSSSSNSVSSSSEGGSQSSEASSSSEPSSSASSEASSSSAVAAAIVSKMVRTDLGFTLLRADDGTVYTFGENSEGIGNDGVTLSWSPVMLENVQDIVTVETGASHAMLLNASGEVSVFGSNEIGELGLGDTTPSATPKMISGLPAIIDVAAGSKFSVLLDVDGKIYTFGDNRYGQLGTGSDDRDTHATPMHIALAYEVTAVEARAFRAVLIDTDGNAYGLGYSGWSALGDGYYQAGAAKIEGLSNIVAASLGSSHGLYLDGDGAVFASGRSTYGQLGLPDTGDGTYDVVATPTQIPGIPAMKMIAAGGDFSLMLDRDGNVWSCGINDNGALGHGDDVTRRIPEKIAGLSGIVSITASTYGALAVDDAGNVYSWGLGGYGNLGTGSSDSFNAPQMIAVKTR